MTTQTAAPATATARTITPRMQNPAALIPGSLAPIMALVKSTTTAGVPATTLELVGLRVSQINGCSFCVGAHADNAKKLGDTDERLHAVAAWHEAPYFTDTERAALALAEAVTRLSDRSDPVPDAVWDEAADHFTEQELAALIMSIGMVNFFNRLNVTTKQPAGQQGW
ncbi:carboxymuconolactone decarboxylase family protein [Streptomyces sp. T-3]|nr:carboxymuconolactone decarboxylase family protein [Streptomyces sp. T-3]